MDARLGWFVTGIVVGAGAASYAGSRAYTNLKIHADSVRVATDSSVLAAHRFSDSIKKKVDVTETKKQKIIVKAVADTAKVDSLLAMAMTNKDTIDALKSQVELLKDVNRNLFQALALSNEQIQAERTRADSLQRAVDGLNVSVQDLARRINALHGTPKWLKIGTEVVKDVGIFVAGVQYGRNN